ncbi:hypothetical protein LCM20_13420 [Halobacillus litoralis]|uniref:hypothetical protein n=1 Tax=Halobacillus litoralis TaxID=45668 RepID=UPI001CD2E0CF|nr:hypothetical protein [Halobacillus litoralis]MCA0971601.1 hypothetical protein [Halobacillus litoralis]
MKDVRSLHLEDLFIKNKSEFNTLRKRVHEVFNLNEKHPDKVFNQKFSSSKSEEFDWAMSGGFWSQLKSLAALTNDEYILIAIVEPDPVNYFYKEFNYYNWAKLPLTLSEDEFFDLLEMGPKESPADAMLYNSFKVVWLPPSEEWAAWGNRSDELCVIGVTKDYMLDIFE